MIKYMARVGYAEIKPIDVVRETEKCIWIERETYGGDVRQSRSSKSSSYENYFDSFGEAKTFLMEHAQRKLDSAIRSLEKAQGYHGNVKGLKE